jgi:2-polyprenyl-6-methoxyphenol hydroxylase-like FAD-dependent oxidoreductase
VHARSVEIFEALGVEARFLAEGVRTRAARFRSDGEVLGELSFAASGSRYGFDIGLSEEVTESVLEAQGGAVTRSTRLIGVVAGEDSVTATLERDGERREVVAQWLVGCDGLHSAVRAAAGIEFIGSDVEAPWAVFDATIEGWEEDYDVVFPHLDTPPVILTPLPGQRWRVYLRPTSDSSDLVAEAGEVIRRYQPEVTFTEVENPARFHCHSQIAARYRSGRVLLAGDAAHACTPEEGHGMNTGLQDSFNLGWKLAMVCRGEAGVGLLDTYEAERRPVAKRVLSSGADVETAYGMTEAGERAERDAEIRRTFADPDTAHHEAAAAAEIDRAYPRSRAVAGDDGSDLRPGLRLPDSRDVEPVNGDPRPLHELTHRRGHTLVVIGGPQADPGRVAEVVTELEGRSDAAVDAVVGLATRPGGPPVGRSRSRSPPSSEPSA